MAKELKQTLTDIANAIRAKDGTTTLMTSQEMPDRIAAIPSGGGGEAPYDVNHFYPAKFGSFVGGEAKLHQYLKSGGNKHLYTNMDGFFASSDITNMDLELDMKNVIDANNFFHECKNLTTISGKIDTSNIINAKYMFSKCELLTTIPDLEFPSLINGYGLFQLDKQLVHPKARYVFPKANDLSFAFQSNTALTALEVEAPMATIIKNMFQSCSNLKTATINAPLAEKADSIFYDYSDNSLLTTVNINIKGGDCSNMFYGCKSLTNITLNISDVVNKARGMFENCSSLKEAPLLSIRATDVSNMFSGCTSLEVIPAYDLITVTSLQSQYQGHFLTTDNLKRFEAYNIGADIDISSIKSNGGQTISHDLLYSIIKGLNNTSGTTKTIKMSYSQADLLTPGEENIIANAGFNLVII